MGRRKRSGRGHKRSGRRGRGRSGRRGGRSDRGRDDILVYGVHPVEEALAVLGKNAEARGRSARLEIARRDGVADALCDAARQLGIAVLNTDPSEIDERAPGANHQGVLLHLGPFPYAELDDVLEAAVQAERPRLLVLDQVQDPHNAGALLRSAAAFGYHGVIVPKDRAAQVTGTVVRISAGGAFHVPVARVTNLARALDAVRDAGFWIYGAAGDDEARDASEVDWSGPAALVMGAEGSGLRRLTRERCDMLVRIPIADAIDSLNVSVAGGILMWAAAR